MKAGRASPLQKGDFYGIFSSARNRLSSRGRCLEVLLPREEQLEKEGYLFSGEEIGEGASRSKGNLNKGSLITDENNKKKERPPLPI